MQEEPLDVVGGGLCVGIVDWEVDKILPSLLKIWATCSSLVKGGCKGVA